MSQDLIFLSRLANQRKERYMRQHSGTALCSMPYIQLLCRFMKRHLLISRLRAARGKALIKLQIMRKMH